MILAFKIGVTAWFALVVGILVVVIALFCTKHKRIEKLMFYVAKGFFAVAVVTLFLAMFATIWSA